MSVSARICAEFHDTGLANSHPDSINKHQQLLPFSSFLSSTPLFAVQNMVRLIAATQEALSVGGKGQEVPITPKWVTPMLLFIDLYEKVSRFEINAII